MRIFHGTDCDFCEFKLPSTPTNHEYYGAALYFSSSKAVAGYYGSRIIELNISRSYIDLTIDAQGLGMKSVSDLRNAINAGGIIEVTNIDDANLMGNQTKQFPYECCDYEEYIYPTGYYIPKMTKKMADLCARHLEIMGLHPFIHKYRWERKPYLIYSVPQLTDDHAAQLSALGIPIMKMMRRTPSTATTIIFAGQKSVDFLNNLLKTE